MSRPSAFIAFGFAAICAGGTDASGPAREDPVRLKAADAIQTLHLQISLPPEVANDTSSWNWDFHAPAWLIWVLGVLFAVILLYALRDMIPGWRSRGDDLWDDGATGAANGASSPEGSLADADLLAGQGRFVDAMHLLLLNSVVQIRERLKMDFPDSLTSREIVRRSRLPEAGAAALRGIVSRVELSYFGDHPAARPDYEACRARYAELTGILMRSAA